MKLTPGQQAIIDKLRRGGDLGSFWSSRGHWVHRNLPRGAKAADVAALEVAGMIHLNGLARMVLTEAAERGELPGQGEEGENG